MFLLSLVLVALTEKYMLSVKVQPSRILLGARIADIIVLLLDPDRMQREVRVFECPGRTDLSYTLSDIHQRRH